MEFSSIVGIYHSRVKMKLVTTTTEFYAAEYSGSPEMIAAYRTVAFAENDAALIRPALNDLARATGMAESKITRQALCAI